MKTVLFEKNQEKRKREYGWFNLSYFNQTAELLLTYKKISSPEHLDNLFNESYKLVSKHENKAAGIVETDIKTSNDHRAKIIDIKGGSNSFSLLLLILQTIF